MATSFAEKQQWVASLEAVTSSNKNSNKIADASVFGNVIFRMPSHGDNCMDVMCTWPLSDEVSNCCFQFFLCFPFIRSLCLFCLFCAFGVFCVACFELSVFLCVFLRSDYISGLNYCARINHIEHIQV